MTEEEHRLIEYRLRREWVGRTFRYRDNLQDDITIVDVRVDYRKDRQDMNRLEDNYGNIWFIFEIEDANFLEEVRDSEGRDI